MDESMIQLMRDMRLELLIALRGNDGVWGVGTYSGSWRPHVFWKTL